MRLNALIIDDEPLIRRGLMNVIDWSEYGFNIINEFSNGKTSLEYIKKNSHKIDVIFIDIKMPEMSGLDVIKEVRKINLNNIYFVILSGFYEFEYAQKAIQYKVTDYLLKPIQREELIKILEKINSEYSIKQKKNKEKLQREKILLDQVLVKEIKKMASKEEKQFLLKKYPNITSVKSIILNVQDNKENGFKFDSISFEEKVIKKISKMYPTKKFHILMTPKDTDNTYEVYLLIFDSVTENKSNEYREIVNFIESFFENNFFNYSIFIGRSYDSLLKLSESYNSAQLVKDYGKFFLQENDVISYEEVPRFNKKEQFLNQKLINQYLKAIKQYDEYQISESINEIYFDFKEKVYHPKDMNKQITFLIHKISSILSEKQKDGELFYVDTISKQLNKERINEEDFLELSLVLSDNLRRMEMKSSTDILASIREDIEKEYMEKLTLKEFGARYFINNVYLGQIFIKEFGEPFNDYLNRIRIEKGCDYLETSDERIYKISEMVGYHNPDYFIKKFLQIKGTTPGKYRLEKKKDS